MERPSFKKETLKFLGLFFILYLGIFTFMSVKSIINRPQIELPPPLSNNSSIDGEGDNQKNRQPVCLATERGDGILIPGIQIQAPLVLVSEGEDFKKALDRGVIFYPDTVLPGQEGETVILGHSAPVGWPKIKYDWVFSDINDLKENDEIYVFFNGCQYLYRVQNTYFLEKGEELPTLSGGNNYFLTLVSCWPPGQDLHRIAVRAFLAEDN